MKHMLSEKKNKKNIPFSVAKKLAFYLTITLTVISLFSVLVFYVYTSTKLEKKLDIQANEMIEFLSGTLLIPLWDFDDRAVVIIGKTISQNYLVGLLIIKDKNGNIIYTETKIRKSDLIIKTNEIWKNGEQIGEVQLGLTTSVNQKSSNEMILFFLITALFNIIALLLGTKIFISKFLETPLNHLNSIVERYSQGIYDINYISIPYLEFRPFGNILTEMGHKIQHNLNELKESEEKFRSFAEQSLVGIYLMQYRVFKYVNPKFAEMFGYSVKECLNGLSINKLIYPDDIKKIDEVIHKSLSGEIKSIRYEIRCVKKNGEIIYTEVFASTFYIDGKSSAIIGTILDITKRKQAEEELKKAKEKAEESEAQLRTLSDNLPGGLVYQIDSGVNGQDRYFSYISAGVESLHGVTATEVLNNAMTIYGQVVEEFKSILAEREAFAAANMIPFSTETKLRLPSGEIRWRLFASAPRRIPNTHLIWDGIEIDITERKQVEESLANEKERLMVTLRSIGDGVITTDTQSRVVLINTVAEELTGWRQDQAGGKHIRQVFHIINEHTRQLSENPVEKIIRTRSITGLANNTLLVSRDGTERIIADSGAPILNRDGNIIGVVLVFRDITQRVLMESELQQAQKLDSIGILAGGIAHDFNNMLGVISGNVSYALAQLDRNNKLFEILTDVQTGTKQAQQLTHQLLTFSKGGAPIKKEADLREILRESALFVTRGSKVRCEFAFPDNLWAVAVDSGQMNQAISNLVINATQSMPDGGIIIIKAENITVSPEDTILLQPGYYLKMTIQDTGVGISEKYISQIFDPYFTTKQKGSGLGLTTTYSIIKKHNGHISVDSKINKGTTFFIYLPTTSPKPFVDKKKKQIEHKGHGKILIMDDQEMILETTCRLLELLGYESVFALDGKQAIAMYKEAFESNRPFDLVILDLTVPGGMGGAETLPELLKIDPKVKAVVSSGYSNDPIMANYQTYGFCGVIPKPFTKADVVEVLDNILSTGNGKFVSISGCRLSSA
ncbi:MAG: PAS domain S-box protein [Desulfobacterales bacterium]|nr:PAS domain S-box protein [Desulfobacterales bacterium]